MRLYYFYSLFKKKIACVHVRMYLCTRMYTFMYFANMILEQHMDTL